MAVMGQGAKWLVVSAEYALTSIPDILADVIGWQSLRCVDT
jgi:hypothetical protein